MHMYFVFAVTYRFDDWRTNSEHYEAIEIGRTQKKPVHCGQCLHIGIFILCLLNALM